MVTIHRAHGLLFIIFSDDHEPAHVHVFGDGEAKINLIGADGAPELISAEGYEAKRPAPRNGCGDRTAGRVPGALEEDTWLS